MRRRNLFAVLIAAAVVVPVSMAGDDFSYPIVVVHGSSEGTTARSGSITLLDHDTFEMKGTLDLPMQPRPMGFDASGRVLIVLGQSATREPTGESTRPWKLFLVDVRSGKTRDLGEVGLPPVGFAFSEESNHVFLLGGVKKKGGTLTVVDLSKETVLRRLPTPAGRPTAILGSGSKRLFAEFGYGETRAGDPEPRMLVFDTVTLDLVTEQALDPSPRRPTLSLDGRHVYVASAGATGADRTEEGSLFIFDAESGRLAAKLATGPGTKSVTPDPDHGIAWTVATGGESGNGSLTAIREAQTVGRLEMSIGYGNVFPVPGRDLVLVMGKSEVHAVRVEPLEIARTWRLEFEPVYAVFDPGRGRAWVSAGYGPDFAVLDVDGGKVLARGAAGRGGAGGKYPAEPGSLVMTMDRDGGHVFLANTRTDDVTVVNAETMEVEEVVATGGRTDSVLVSPEGSCVYVVSEEALVRIDRNTREAVTQCALAARSGLAGVLNVHDGIALVPQRAGLEFIDLDDGKSVGRADFPKPVDYVFVSSPER